MRHGMGWMAAVATAAISALACGGGGSSGGSNGSMQNAQSAPADSAATPGMASGADTSSTSSSSGASAGASGSITTPGWMKVDKGAKTVSMDIQAGKTPVNNHWNFNGFTNGDTTITVPAGYKITIDFKNDDPVLAHSLGVDTRTGNFDATITPQPAFPGAVTPNPTNPAQGTQPGKSDKITFTADKPGSYTIVCYMPGHAATGMWTHFVVSSSGQAGVSAGK
ncbi:MAG TPA: sulfocyanin-like copper-binding protein [Gemmatimonadales bacterium]|nr:sulfocyanin-like copper-binding protein [Gemmatimonadales bacterium]